MSTKKELLRLLKAQQGGCLSGEEAATCLGVTRAAVWKAVHSLREEGFAVTSEAGSGYCLQEGDDILTEEAVWMYSQPEEAAVRVLEETDSTNLQAKRWAVQGAPHGAMVLAARQTAGRGRLGRSFVSPQGGLYLSIVLRPPVGGVFRAGLVTSGAAVAVCRVLEQHCGLQPGIKWVNDLFINGKKCCGILTEATTSIEDGSLDSVVVGIGINYTTSPEALMPKDVPIATSLYPGGNAPISRAQLAVEIRRELLAMFAQMENRAFLAEYRQRSIVLGREVMVMAAQPYAAQAVEINDEAALVVRCADGTQKVLNYGEISVKL